MDVRWGVRVAVACLFVDWCRLLPRSGPSSHLATALDLSKDRSVAVLV